MNGKDFLCWFLLFGSLIAASFGFLPPTAHSPRVSRIPPAVAFRPLCRHPHPRFLSLGVLQETLSVPVVFIISNAVSLNDWQMPLVLSLMAGLSTCLGAAVVFLTPRDNNQKVNDDQLAFSLSLAGSVMVTVSIVSILPESFHNAPIQSAAFVQRCLSLAIGCGLYLLIAKWFPEPDSVLSLPVSKTPSSLTVPGSSQQDSLRLDRYDVPTGSMHQQEKTHDLHDGTKATVLPAFDTEFYFKKEFAPQSPFALTDRLHWTTFVSGSDLTSTQSRHEWRVAILLFLSLVVHNFPEGLAVAASSFHSPQLGLTTALAIALHNIPEGIAIAVPCLAARPDAPMLAFGLASLSGLAEPLGAAVALLFMNSSPDGGDGWSNMENMLAFVAGIMTTVAVVELFPEALQHAKTQKFSLALGTVSGAVVMLVSEAALQ